MVPNAEVANLRPDLFYNAGELMAEGHPDTSIGNEAVVEMQV
jgi:hypothetical protein